mmetsp:Transcript_16058/g.15466  ORF Transcript_16058/g.15466 Transcript_16058/m.15466 type:complete len:91 (-) Transcript_16058:29-301(-)
MRFQAKLPKEVPPGAGVKFCKESKDMSSPSQYLIINGWKGIKRYPWIYHSDTRWLYKFFTRSQIRICSSMCRPYGEIRMHIFDNNYIFIT